MEPEVSEPRLKHRPARGEASVLCGGDSTGRGGSSVRSSLQHPPRRSHPSSRRAPPRRRRLPWSGAPAPALGSQRAGTAGTARNPREDARTRTARSHARSGRGRLGGFWDGSRSWGRAGWGWGVGGEGFGAARAPSAGGGAAGRPLGSPFALSRFSPLIATQHALARRPGDSASLEPVAAASPTSFVPLASARDRAGPHLPSAR